MLRKLALLATAVLAVAPLTVLGPTQAQTRPHRSEVPTFGTALLGTAPTGHNPGATVYDATTDTIYVANGFNPNGPNPTGDTVTVIDGRRCDARSVARCRGPWPTITVGSDTSSLVVDAAHHTLYAGSYDGSVFVADIAACHARDVSGCGTAVATVTVGAGTYGMALDPATGTLYTADLDVSTVSMVDTTTCNAITPAGCPDAAPSFPTGEGAGELDIDDRTHTAYVATFSGFSAFDTSTCNATDQSGCGDQGEFTVCDGCFGPFSLVVDEDTDTVYVPDGEHSIAAVDIRGCRAGALEGCATAPSGKVVLPGTFYSHLLYLVVDDALDSVYVLANRNGTVVMLDTGVCNGRTPAGCEGLEPEQVRAGTDPVGIDLDEQTHTLYVANQLDNDLAVIDAARCSAHDSSGCRVLPPRIPVPSANGVAVSGRVNTAYVTGRDEIAMVDIQACNYVSPSGCAAPHPTVADPEHPWAVAVDESRHTAYVANVGDDVGSLSVFDTRACNAHPSSGCGLVATLPLPSGHGADVAVDERRGRVYVAAADPQGEDTVALFDGTTCNASVTSGCGQQATVLPMASGVGPCDTPARMGLAVDQPTGTLYATHMPCDSPRDRIYVYDGAGGTPLASVPVPENAVGLAVDEHTRTLYAALLRDGETRGALGVVDLRHCHARDTSGCDTSPAVVPAGFGSLRVAVDQRSHGVYIANDEDAGVSVYDGRNCRAGRTTGCSRPPALVLADDYPAAFLALAPSVRTTYVASAAAGTVALVPMAR